MKPSIQTLGQILYSPSQYVIPVFQRNYRWETAEWEKLWNSLEEIQQPTKTGNHFMGFLVFVPGLPQPGQNTTFHIIDGQQRLMTLSLLLGAIRNVAHEEGQEELAKEVHEYYLVHPLKKGEQHYRLLPKERDHDSYIAIINRTGVPVGRVTEAVGYFEGKLATTEPDNANPRRLRDLFDIVRQRLEFMCATLEAENAYNIFKSLNSTGVPLGQADLIRNFVFMHVLPDDQEEFDRELWTPFENRFARENGTLDEDRFSRFFRDFLMSAGKYVPPKDTFSTFEARYEATAFSPKDLAKTLDEFSNFYEIINGQKPDRSESVTRALSNLNALESSTTYPLLLGLFCRRAEGTISDAQLLKAIEMLCGFIIRRFICNESSRGYGQMFVRALAEDKGEPIHALEQFLLDRGWPDDYKFETAFGEFPLYERGYTKHVLERLERDRGHKERVDLNDAQVEHVMPRTLNEAWRVGLGEEAERIHSEWLHRPGNLTLSGYNPELWNHPFARKRERYATSNIVLTRELASQAEWGEQEIRKRGEELAKQAVTIWTGPKEKFIRREAESDDDDDTDEPDRFEIRRRFWTGLNEFLVSKYPELPDFEGRPKWTLRLPSGVRHVGFNLRFSLRHSAVGIDVWFWREQSFPLWELICSAPGDYNELIGTKWEFERKEDKAQARMYIELLVKNLRAESSWPDTYCWFGEKLNLLYTAIAAKLREQSARL